MHAVASGFETSSMAGFTPVDRRVRVAIVRTSLTTLVALCATLAGCSRAATYELRGQILVIDRNRQEITVKHEDVRGFMPGMTMPFKVDDPKRLDDLTVGDLIEATLVVKDSTGYLAAIKRTGHQDAVAAAPLPRMDLLEPGQEIPDAALVDETGQPRNLADWRGRVLAVTFIYTRCPYPDFCPRMDRQFKSAQTVILGDPQLRSRAALLSVSFDPEFDTPPVLAAHGKQVGADSAVWHFATGDRSAIEALASRFGVSVMREGTAAEGVTHNLRTAVIGSDGRLSAMLTGNEWTPAELIDAMRRAH
jgi:protein SCO1/2